MYSVCATRIPVEHFHDVGKHNGTHCKTKMNDSDDRGYNAFTAGNLCSGTKLLGVSIGRGVLGLFTGCFYPFLGQNSLELVQ